MSYQIDPMWLRSFHCVYENKSFKRAAEFLNLPSSNVSRHIALLEEKLAVRLFDRTTRRMTETDAGERLYWRTQPLLEQLNEAFEEVSQHTNDVQGQLKILMPDSPELAQAVVSFCTQHPCLSLCCDTSINPKDDPLEGFDLVLSFHRGELADNSWIAKEIKRWPSAVVASPQCIKAHSQPYKLSDLKQVPCISSFTVINASPWIFKRHHSENIIQSVDSSFRVNSGHLAKSAALEGLGFAILPIEFCRKELDSGSLIEVEMEYQPEDLVLYAFYASRKHLAKKIPMFIEHLDKYVANKMQP